MTITIRESHIGGLLIEPVNPKAKETILSFINDMRGPTESATVFINIGQVEEARRGILRFVTEQQWDEIASGYTVEAEGDTWELLHLWGWDAHTLAEAGKL